MTMQLHDAIAQAMQSWTEEQKMEWEERAAIIEEGDKISRDQAEAAAFFELRKKFRPARGERAAG